MNLQIFIISIFLLSLIKKTLSTKIPESNLMNRTVKKIIHATERPEGVGAIVRRFVGVDGMRQFSPFLMADHFSGGEGGFPEHPHLGQETITYITKGAFAHEDFTGSKGILYAGDLQFMTAGKGVVHSEMPVRLPDGVTPAGIQLWVDLPHELKEVSPRYRDLRAYEIPEAVEQDGKLTVKVISGNSYGVESLKDLAYTPIHYYHYIMKPGSIFEQPVPENFNVFLYVTQGNGLRLSDGNTLKQNSAAFFKMDGSSIKGANPLDSDNNIEFMLVGGEVLDQHTVHYGPFVAKDQERIRRAFADYQNARNGFANLKTWKTLISGGVTEDMIQNDLNGSLELRKKAEQEYLSRKAAEHQTPIEPVKDEL